MRVGAVEPRRAVEQHATLVRQLVTLGAKVDVLPFVHGAYDSVFAKDSAVLVCHDGARRALLAHPRHAERRAEQGARQHALEAHGFCLAPALDAPLEGGDVVVDARSGASKGFLGHGFRSSRRSIDALERFLDTPVTPLALRDPELYHLDMALAVLDDLALVCEEALTRDAMREIVCAFGADNVVRVSVAEAKSFALNIIPVGRHVVLSAGTPSFEGTLRALGYVPHPVPLSEFHFAGGSAACLVARVHSWDRRAVSTTAAIRSTAA